MLFSPNERTSPPFAWFFLFASLDAAAGVGALLLYFVSGADMAGGATDSLFAWHGRELVFGYAPGVCTGFLLTALPRWTKRTPGPVSETVLFFLWLEARFAILLPPAGAPIIAAPLFGLAAVVSFHVIAAHDRRDFKVIALLWLSAAGGLLVALPGAPTAQLGLNLGLAASIGLVMIIGGRVVSSVTANMLERRGEPSLIWHSAIVEIFAALGATVGLAVWVVHPTGAPMTLAGLFAAATQLGRLAQWRGWTAIRVPAVLIFHLAYAFVPTGFALFALNATLPHFVPASAALHAWTAGGMGLMTLGIMGSMIRRRTGRAFLTSGLGMCVFALAIVAAMTRIAAEFSAQAKPWLIIAAACWIVAFLLFVLDFRMPLLHRIGLRDRSWRGTTPRQESADRLS